jgi:hypothetical protein
VLFESGLYQALILAYFSIEFRGYRKRFSRGIDKNRDGLFIKIR